MVKFKYRIGNSGYGCGGGFGVGPRLIIRPNSAFEDCVSGADPRNFIRPSALSSDISIWTHAA